MQIMTKDGWKSFPFTWKGSNQRTFVHYWMTKYSDGQDYCHRVSEDIRQMQEQRGSNAS